MEDIKTQKLCECGCGLPAPVASRNWHSKNIKKGQQLRFVCGHHRRGVLQTSEEKMKRSKKWGTRESALSPYLPSRTVRFGKSQKRWYCSNPKKYSSTIPHAKAVYEHFIGPVDSDMCIHHISGSAATLEDDRPENLLAVPRIWNLHYFPTLAIGFNVPESIVTEKYIQCLRSNVLKENIFAEVCKKLISRD